MAKLCKISRTFVPIVYLLHNQNIKSNQILCKRVPVKNILFYSTIPKGKQYVVLRDAFLKYQIIPINAPKMKRVDLGAYQNLPSKPAKQTTYDEKTNRADDSKYYQIPKDLPKLGDFHCGCPECLEHTPTYAPKLKRLKPMYDDTHMKWRHKTVHKNEYKPERMDEVRGYNGRRKKLLPYIKKYYGE